MLRKGAVFLSVVAVMSLILSNTCYAMQLFSREEAFNNVFGEGVQISTENKKLTLEELSKVKERLGGTLHYLNRDSKSEIVPDHYDINFDFVLKDGKKTGVAIIDTEPGKWGLVEVFIALDLNGTVKTVKVLNYQEKRGSAVARQGYLAQFDGKNGKSLFELNKDISAISGATVSSGCVNFAVKKAVVMYEEVYINK